MPGLNLFGIHSSYAENDYGQLFYALARILKPSLVVELGTYMGYSALHFAAAMRDNTSVNSELHMIDLWEAYSYRRCTKNVTMEHFRHSELLGVNNLKLEFINADAEQSWTNYEDDSIDILHVDLSNDGRSLNRCLQAWSPKLNRDGLLLFEGGSQERDRIDRMVKYQKSPIRDFIDSHWFTDHFEAVTLAPFPSLTISRLKK
ncbi:MAG: O-methyltransferase [bacterium]